MREGRELRQSEQVSLLIARYELIDNPTPDVAYVLWEGKKQVWTATVMRKRHVCAICYQQILCGTRAFRPTTNADNRLHRVCAAHWERTSPR